MPFLNFLISSKKQTNYAKIFQSLFTWNTFSKSTDQKLKVSEQKREEKNDFPRKSKKKTSTCIILLFNAHGNYQILTNNQNFDFVNIQTQKKFINFLIFF
jgi:hypothetical protein